MTFRTVRSIGLRLLAVGESTMYGSPALKVGGQMVACIASNKSAEPGTLGAIVAITALANVLQLQAARYLPFGLRASIILTGTALGTELLGYSVLGERLSVATGAWCALVVLGAVLAAPGEHASHEIEPRLLPGILLSLTSAGLMAVVALLTKGLTERTHALLTAWSLMA
jgi:drug/metabolite transporter (DMT)-like permease